jgi:hypothetical protein
MTVITLAQQTGIGEERHFVTAHISGAIAMHHLENGLLSETELLWGPKNKK